MTRFTTAALSGIGLIALLAGPAIAQEAGRAPEGARPRVHRGMHGRVMPGLPLRALDLTDAQREQVRGIMTARQPEFRALHERLRTTRQAEQAAVTRVPVDENEVRTRVSELSAVQADLAVLRARVHEQIFQVLTPEQQAKAKTIAAERQKRRSERMERRRGRV
jgi:Spy/CpxP family protein refolding chaperone